MWDGDFVKWNLVIHLSQKQSYIPSHQQSLDKSKIREITINLYFFKL